MRLFFFPALIPLASVLPELLALVGVVAGAWQYLRGRKALLITGTLIALAAATATWRTLARRGLEEGSRLTAAKDLPITEHFASATLKAPELFTFTGRSIRYHEGWSSLLSRKALGTPLITQGHLLLGTWSGTLDAFDLTTGAPLWSMRKSEPILARPVEAGGVGYSGDGLHTAQKSALTAIHLETGQAIWQREFRGHLEVSPTLDPARARIYMASGPGGIWALSTASGAVIWHAAIGHVDATPLLQEGRLIVPAQPDERLPQSLLYALDAETGKPLWKIPLPGQPWGAPTAAAEGIFLTTAIGRLEEPQSTDRGWVHAVTPAGKLLWSRRLPGMALFEAQVVEKRVILTLKTGSIVALHAEDGRDAWSAKLGASTTAAAALQSQSNPPLLAVVERTGKVDLLSARDGATVQTLEVGPQSTSTPVFYGNRLVITSPESITDFEASEAP